MTSRLSQQIQFVLEIDQLKQILRQTRLTNGSRRENSAEHSWHIALMAPLLFEYAPPGADLLTVVKMLLIHDLVEIDAGDTFCYDTAANLDKAEREQQAAERIFGLLPPDQQSELRLLWAEFEAQDSPSARFANDLDRLQPILLNQQNQGGTWKANQITQAQVLRRVEPIQTGAPDLWPYLQQILQDAVAAGYLLPDPASPATASFCASSTRSRY